MDSQQFPKAKFKRTITSEKRLPKDGVYKTSVNGQMTIKGISKPLTVEGTIDIVNDKVIIISTFIIKGNEFGLETKYAKEIEVTINITY
jgi:polyisoprenoid-binding protein YceI